MKHNPTTASGRRKTWPLMLLLVSPWGWAQDWFEGGQPTEPARQAVQWLTQADADGLRPADYHAPVLAEVLARATQSPLDETSRQQASQVLQSAMERYLRDLRDGRVDPRTLHHNFQPARQETFDAKAAVDTARDTAGIDEAVRSVTPRLPMYGQLKMSLAAYRALANHPAWAAALPALPGGRGGAVRPGQTWTGLEALARRLKALGDLETAPKSQGNGVPIRLEGTLVDALKSFQQRHGQTADGVLGPATWAQLQVKPEQRARQIELSMERLRWTPLEQGSRMVVVNIPEFVLRAYEIRDGEIRVEREMRVIVGKAMDHNTPVFDEDMRFVEFSPYWNVPPSIAKEELIPRLRRDPGYFTRMGFEFVGGDGKGDTAFSSGKLGAVQSGQMRIRQRPGPQNALGDIKFVFPNRDNIYLHHTPSVGLFAKDRRDFSHGCIRVEKPVELATFVLQNQPEWTEKRIVQAMEKGTSSTIRLAEPLPVLIAYGTSLVKNGRIHFHEDIYGLDKALDEALKREKPRPVTP